MGEVDSQVDCGKYRWDHRLKEAMFGKSAFARLLDPSACWGQFEENEVKGSGFGRGGHRSSSFPPKPIVTPNGGWGEVDSSLKAGSIVGTTDVTVAGFSLSDCLPMERRPADEGERRGVGVQETPSTPSAISLAAWIFPHYLATRSTTPTTKLTQALFTDTSNMGSMDLLPRIPETRPLHTPTHPERLDSGRDTFGLLRLGVKIGTFGGGHAWQKRLHQSPVEEEEMAGSMEDLVRASYQMAGPVEGIMERTEYQGVEYGCGGRGGHRSSSTGNLCWFLLFSTTDVKLASDVGKSTFAKFLVPVEGIMEKTKYQGVKSGGENIDPLQEETPVPL
ncbi:regulatory subunit of protein kinase A [Apiospora saccharicola]|uniref:Regulatory subunit of protein kinase A n=1 Tax=Apiospora saccharicola TaxID=335842 RepID=A0ABR1VB54_9PEZI